MHNVVKVIFDRLFALIFLLGLFCPIANAVSTSELRFRRLASLGADQLSTISLIQDQQGFVWIGTNNAGLYRYDGYKSEKYQLQSNNPKSLPHDRVSALFEDKEGRIWVGTQNGLARFNRASGDFTRFFPSAGPNNQRIIKSIVSDGKTGMWLATWGGLLHFDPIKERFTIYEHDPVRGSSLATNDLNAITLDDRGGVWAGTWPAGLDYLAPGAINFVHFRIDTDLLLDTKLNIVRSLHLDVQRNLWIGTENGVVKWNTASEWSKRKRLDSPNSRVNSIYEDRDGTTWAATLSAGLLRWEKGSGKFTQFVKRAIDPYSLPSDDIRAILHDRGGLLWVASLTDGIALTNLNSKGFKRIIPVDQDLANPRPNNALLRIAGASKGRLWLSSNSGVVLYDIAKATVLKQYQADSKRAGSLSNNLAYSLYRENSGRLWVGTSVD